VPVDKYPAKVVGEFDTIRKILKGFNIGRIGDGEVKVLDGKAYTRMRAPVPAMTFEMSEMAINPHPRCLIGIPTMDPAGTKFASFIRHEARFCKFLSDKVTYYSALISRPDCGAWLETQEYANHVQKIWKDKKRVAIVSEVDSKLLANVQKTHDVFHIPCPMYDAWDGIDDYEVQLVKYKPDVALLSLGPTATVLAHRMAKHNIHAVDLGSIGGFLNRWL
jgi:hypothetical protein